ncbi:putative hydrolase or acyltransferase of alpha/beta superfamily [Burkholderiales bacterium JOSHI_001]|nr:putative hydrolase or acyltransferase of alpha/beta superfamily [Burkholderiales bacterium JOSHI_001]
MAPSTSSPASPVTQRCVRTATLDVALDELNPGGARTALLLHGWPDAPLTWHPVGRNLAAAGWRVLMPALRGVGETRFVRADTPRSGQLAALGRDLLDLLDALALPAPPLLVGHDWGARAVANACGLRPGVASHLVMVSVGYGTNLPGQDLSLSQARNYWYHWYMATARGERAVRDQRRDFARMMWDTWAPTGWYTEDDFLSAAAAWDHPDWADIVLHSYRHRWGHAPGFEVHAADEAALSPPPRLAVPTLVIHGEVDGANHPSTSAGKEGFFSGRYERIVLPGVGHFPQREATPAVAEAILRFVG